MKKIEIFKVEGNKINRTHRHCPKCGPAVFLADHKNRFSCGKCGYTEFKGGNKKQSNNPLEISEKNVENENKINNKESNQKSNSESISS